MSVRIVRLDTARTEGEGTRIGTVRRPPRSHQHAGGLYQHYGNCYAWSFIAHDGRPVLFEGVFA